MGGFGGQCAAFSGVIAGSIMDNRRPTLTVSETSGGGSDTWLRRASAIADAADFLFTGETVDTQRFVLARLIAKWCSQFPPPTFPNIVDPDVETRDAAMGRLLSELHRAEAQLEREKWLSSAQ